MTPDVRQRRALACIETLSSISQYERRDFPSRRTEKFTIPKISSYLTLSIMTGQHIPLPITKGICAIAALDRQNFIGQFYDPNDHQYKFPSNVLLLSQEADEALKDIAKMWHKLEAEFTRYQSHPEDHQVDIRNAAVEYLEELKARSQPLLKQHDLFKWYYMLPDGCYSLKYPNATPIESGLYALQVRLFMKRIGVYSPLPDATPVPFLNAHELDPALCKNWNLSLDSLPS